MKYNAPHVAFLDPLIHQVCDVGVCVRAQVLVGTLVE